MWRKKDIDPNSKLSLIRLAQLKNYLQVPMPVIVWPKIAMQLKEETKRGNGRGQIFR
jgi:hypothetical protein